MIDILSIFECFKLLTGVQDEDLEKYLPICSSALTEITSRLRFDVNVSEYESRLVFACSALAAYRYRLISTAQDDGITFKAGDVSVSKRPNGSTEMSLKVYEEAISDLSAILKDNGFLFCCI